MSLQQTILVATFVIVASFFVSAHMRPAEAQRTGPFQLMQHSNTTAAAGVFRLDTSSGEVSFCYANSQNEPVCSKPVP